ncbi:MAG: hypothetical protein IJ703_01355 [Eubacterium sp.]|nr:hypothetical protein [Eubacterium sp.]
MLRPRKQGTEEAERALALQRLARHQMIEKLYKDILVDMQVCKLEDWDQMEYIRDLQSCINHFKTGGVKNV